MNTNNIVMWETLPNNADWVGLFQDSDFAGDLEDSGGTLCIFGSHTFVPISWMCEKQTSVSHSSTESDIISLDVGSRLDGIPALDLWYLIVAVLLIKMISKGRSPTMRHVSRTHRVALDWLFDLINLDSKNPNQIHGHQKPTHRHIDEGKFHT